MQFIVLVNWHKINILISLGDQETGKIIEFDTGSKQFQTEYKRNKIKQENLLNDRFKKSGIDFLKIKTDENYILSIDKFLKRRIKI